VSPPARYRSPPVGEYFDALANHATLAVTDATARESLPAAWAAADRLDREHTMSLLHNRNAVAVSVRLFGYTPSPNAAAAESALTLIHSLGLTL
jgi:hypothetical protein